MKPILSAIVTLSILAVASTALAQSTEPAADSAKPSTTAPSAAQAKQILQQTRPLAEQGDASAQYNMGVLYDQGYGVKQNYDTAREWYRKAAKQGFAKAAHNLGIMYESGKGVAPDPKQAAQWFQRAAEGGEPAAQNNLAVLYVRGEGVPRDVGLAAYWAAHAAANGNQSAIDNLSKIVSDLPHAHVNGSNVNVRSGPSKDDTVVHRADSATELVVLNRKGDWTQVLFPGDYVTGWIANLLMADSQAPLAASDQSTSDSSAEPAPAGQQASTDKAATKDGEASDKATSASAESNAASATGSDAASSGDKRAVGVSAANVRNNPSASAKVVFQAHRGDILTVVARQNGWLRVRSAKGDTGWVAGFLLTAAPD